MTTIKNLITKKIGIQRFLFVSTIAMILSALSFELGSYISYKGINMQNQFGVVSATFFFHFIFPLITITSLILAIYDQYENENNN